jgi:hypothetical protein
MDYVVEFVYNVVLHAISGIGMLRNMVFPDLPLYRVTNNQRFNIIRWPMAEIFISLEFLLLELFLPGLIVVQVPA